MSKLLIENARYVATMNDDNLEFSGGHILIDNGVITSIGSDLYEGAVNERIDATDMLIIPGLINTHHHLFQSLTRNIPRMQDQGLFEWLTNHYELWRGLDRQAVRVSAKLALLELMKSGVTTSSDHLYLFPQGVAGDLIDAEIESAVELGLRFQPTRGSMSLGRSKGGLPPDDVIQDDDVIMADAQRLVETYHDPEPGAMLRISLAPCSPFNVTSELMKRTADFALANDLRMHTHLAETLDEEAFCFKTYGKRPLAYMKALNWIHPNAWFAHCIYLNDDEIQLMGANGVGISHCPSSNMRLGSGIARIRELLDAGINVSLGVDGSASNDSGDMLLEMRNALLLSRLREQPFWLTARDVLKMATRGGAAVLGRDDIGELSVGKRADLALFNLKGISQAGSLADPLASLVFTTRPSGVDTLIVEGKIRIQNQKSAVDEEVLVEEHNSISDALLETAKKSTGIDFSTPITER